jgi:hypothetical protein
MSINIGSITIQISIKRSSNRPRPLKPCTLDSVTPETNKNAISEQNTKV